MADRLYTVTLSPTDYRAAASVLAERAAATEQPIREPIRDEKGVALPVEIEDAEQPTPIIPLTLTIEVPHPSGLVVPETVTAVYAWQLTGNYGNTAKLVDLDDAALAEVLDIWAANILASVDATLADPAYAAEVAKVEALRARLAGRA